MTVADWEAVAAEGVAGAVGAAGEEMASAMEEGGEEVADWVVVEARLA